MTYFVRTDHIGRPSFATDGTGAVVWDASYKPFGEVNASTGAPINLRFPGQWFSSESDLNQNWMRDYDPTTGRYIQADPLGLVDGASVYGYARQNPNRYIDPRGEFGLFGAALGAGSNAGFQFIGNYLRYGSFLTALKCIDISKVVVSGALGAIGGSPLKAFKNKGLGIALGVDALGSYLKLGVPKITIGDECECDGGKDPDTPIGKAIDAIGSLQL